jgi:hypothetical protein
MLGGTREIIAYRVQGLSVLNQYVLVQENLVQEDGGLIDHPDVEELDGLVQ